MIPWILVSIFVLLILFFVLAIVFRKKGKARDPDYRSFFMMGLVWIVFGIYFYISSKGITFLLLGVVFSGIGLINKKKWKKPKKWSELSSDEKKLKIILILSLVVLVLVGVLLQFLR